MNNEQKSDSLRDALVTAAQAFLSHENTPSASVNMDAEKIILVGDKKAVARLFGLAVEDDDGSAELTDEQIVRVWHSMPGGPDGWLKHFGFIQFARAVLAEAALAARTNGGGDE